jgi:hypothetical protein
MSKQGLNLRVYRRTQEHIALLWNKSALNAEQLQNLEIFLVDEKGRRKMEFATSQQMESILEEGIVTPDDTVLAIIKHASNKLDPYAEYSFEIIFNRDYKAKILVYPFGVLPPTEKDDKKANVHVYGFITDEGKWGKLPLVRCKDGTFAVPIVLKKEE